MSEGARTPLSVRALGCVPKAAVSRWAARVAAAPGSRRLIGPFAHHYGVALEEAEIPPGGFASLGEFFVRRLRPGTRPIDARPGAVVSPVDGCVGACGRLDRDRLLQAKGRTYTSAALLADADAAARFENGLYLTLYLAPRDYHRVHAPLAGAVRAARYIPGRHWPVHARAVAAIGDLFATNERLVTYISSAAGECALVMVGACIVGGLKVNYDPHLTAGARAYDPPVPLAAGDELGRFEFGSTVVLLLQRGELDAAAQPGASIRVGEAVAWRDHGSSGRPVAGRS